MLCKIKENEIPKPGRLTAKCLGKSGSKTVIAKWNRILWKGE